MNTHYFFFQSKIFHKVGEAIVSNLEVPTKSEIRWKWGVVVDMESVYHVGLLDPVSTYFPSHMPEKSG